MAQLIVNNANGRVEVTVGEDGSVSVIGAKSVKSSFQTKNEDGCKYVVDVGPGTYDLDIVLRGTKGWLADATCALVVDYDRQEVCAQDGASLWKTRHQLFPRLVGGY